MNISPNCSSHDVHPPYSYNFMKFIKSIYFWLSILCIVLCIGAGWLIPVGGTGGWGIRLLISALMAIVSVLSIIMVRYLALLRVVKAGGREGQYDQAGAASIDNAWYGALLSETREGFKALRNSAGIKKALFDVSKKGHKLYLIVGAQGSGKSTLMENSCLNQVKKFPSDEQLSEKSLNFFRWYMCAATAYIEIPHQLVDAHPPTLGTEQYQAFLTLLKKERKQNAIDGLVLAVSLQDMLVNIEGIKLLAVKWRQILIKAASIAQLDIPVYVIFTHTDILPGFSDFFRGLRGLEREQVFGATFALTSQGTTIKAQFEREYAALGNSLHLKAPYQLKMLSTEDEKQRAFLFPHEFLAAQNNLACFIEQLFKKDTAGVSLLLRGFFFTSALPIDSNNYAAAAFSGAGTGSAAAFSNTLVSHPLNPRASNGPGMNISPSPGVSNSLFTGMLFTGLLQNQKPLARFPAYRRRRMSGVGLLVCGLSLLVFLFLTVFGFSSYTLCSRLGCNIAGAMQKTALLGWHSSLAFPHELTELDKLGNLYGETLSWEKNGRPWYVSPFYFKEHKWRQLMGEMYLYQLHQLVMRPVLADLTADIYAGSIAPDASKDTLYRTLKLYLAITKAGVPYRHLLSVQQVVNELYPRWESVFIQRNGTASLSLSSTVSLRKHLDLYASVLTAGPLPTDWLAEYHVNEQLVSSARSTLSGNPSIQALYEEALTGCGKWEDINLSKMGVDPQGILASTMVVNGAYTKAAYQDKITNRISQAAEGVFKGDWVLGSAPLELPREMRDKAKVKAAVNNRYYQEYYNEWTGFLKSLTVNAPSDPGTLSGKVIAFASDNQGVRAVLKRLLEEVNVFPVQDKHLERALETKSQKSLTRQWAKDKWEGRQDPRAHLLERFEPVQRLYGKDGSTGLLKDYLDAVRNLGQALGHISLQDDDGTALLEFTQEVFNNKQLNPLVRSWNQSILVMEQMPEEVKLWLQPLLQSLLVQVMQQITSKVELKLQSEYHAKVYTPFLASLKGRYPLARGAQVEANVQDMGDFLNPADGAFFGFYRTYLESFLKPQQDGYSLKQWNGLCLKMSESSLVMINNIFKLSQRIYQPSSKSFRQYSVELTLISSGQVTQAHLNLCGTQIITHGEPEGVKGRVLWPLEMHNETVISAQLPGGLQQSIKEEGPWAFLKLLSKSKYFTPNPYGFKCVYRMKAKGKYEADIHLNAIIMESVNPFTLNSFYSFDCVERLFDGSGASEGYVKSKL